MTKPLSHITGGIAAAFSAALLAATPLAAAEIELLAGGISPPNSLEAKASEEFVKLVSERSEGRIEITYLSGGQLGNGQEEMEAVITGTQDMFLSSGSQASRLVKAIGVLDTAFLFKDFEHVKRFLASDMWTGLNEELEQDYGVTTISSNWFGTPRYLLHTSKFIMTPEDVAGVRVRAPGVPMYIQNYENMGATPVKIAYGEQYLALSQGVVDMTEAAASRILGPKLYEVAPYVTEADMMFPQSSVWINTARWEGLSEEDRALITKAADDAGDLLTKWSQENWAKDKQTLEGMGTKFEAMPEETRQAFAEMGAAKVDEMVEKDLLREGWYERILDLRDAE